MGIRIQEVCDGSGYRPIGPSDWRSGDGGGVGQYLVAVGTGRNDLGPARHCGLGAVLASNDQSRSLVRVAGAGHKRPLSARTHAELRTLRIDQRRPAVTVAQSVLRKPSTHSLARLRPELLVG